jgi:hypothetical protein
VCFFLKQGFVNQVEEDMSCVFFFSFVGRVGSVVANASSYMQSLVTEPSSFKGNGDATLFPINAASLVLAFDVQKAGCTRPPLPPPPSCFSPDNLIFVSKVSDSIFFF